MLVEIISLLKLKEEEEKQMSYRSGAVKGIIMVVLLSIILPVLIVYIAYKNNEFVFNCKNGSVIHWILANILSIFYYIYSFITTCLN